MSDEGGATLSLVLFGVVLSLLIVALGCWLGDQLLRQNGRILLRLEALDERLDRLGEVAAMGGTADPIGQRMPAPGTPPGLPRGSVAPPFELPDLQGAAVRLEDFRGRRILLLSWDPQCGFCRRMAPDLAALPIDGSRGRPVPLMITTGDPEQNRALIAECGIRCPVLLQQTVEVTSRYQATATPMGYLIDEKGIIASDLAAGADALLALAAQESAPVGELTAVNTNGHRVSKDDRPLETSRLIRDGLPAGTAAPAFRLPRLDGGELSLEEYRGRRVLLIFSDPSCGPCMRMLPELEQLHCRTRDLAVVLISRGEIDTNRTKVTGYGLTFPVVLQRQWEVSRDYGIFATPVGYLINEKGVLATGVATGADAILALASQTV
jgi:peroxiredoxin